LAIHIVTPTGAIYAIKCQPIGHAYIGASINPARRWSSHKTALRAGCHRNKNLQKLWDSLEESSFLFEVLEYVPIDGMHDAEQKWMDYTEKTTTLLNLIPCRGTGAIHTEKVRRQMRGSRIGLQPGSRNPRAKITEEDVSTIRRLHTEGMKGVDIAKLFCVTNKSISLMVLRKTWRHVP